MVHKIAARRELEGGAGSASGQDRPGTQDHVVETGIRDCDLAGGQTGERDIAGGRGSSGAARAVAQFDRDAAAVGVQRGAGGLRDDRSAVVAVGGDRARSGGVIYVKE